MQQGMSSLLPPQNLSGNLIKIVQRLPVRVALDQEELKAHPLRLGLSMETRVFTKDDEGLMVPKTTAGSPLYETPIFKYEEKGDENLIEQIVLSNLDPQLHTFFDLKLNTESLDAYQRPDFQ